MKSVLFLDDDPRRTKEFVDYASRYNWQLTTVETADECINSLRTDVYDLVLLDHDLGGETFVDSNRADTGMEVVRWLAKNTGEHRAFIVHTMNAVAAASMYFGLTTLEYRAAQAPFGSPEFFDLVSQLLGEDKPRRRSRSLTERIGDYFRSLGRNRM